jgi:hypothetical protein
MSDPNEAANKDCSSPSSHQARVNEIVKELLREKLSLEKTGGHANSRKLLALGESPATRQERVRKFSMLILYTFYVTFPQKKVPRLFFSFYQTQQNFFPSVISLVLPIPESRCI